MKNNRYLDDDGIFQDFSRLNEVVKRKVVALEIKEDEPIAEVVKKDLPSREELELLLAVELRAMAGGKANRKMSKSKIIDIILGS